MRATDIGIRSPREFTPAPYTASTTYDGRSLFNSLRGRTQSFRRAERFSQYHQEARKTGFRVGPGSYNIDSTAIGRFRALKTPLYKSLHGVFKGKNSSYYMVGQSLVSYQQKRFSSAESPVTRTTRSSLGRRIPKKQVLNRRRTIGPYRPHSPRVSSPRDQIRTRNIKIRSKTRQR